MSHRARSVEHSEKPVSQQQQVASSRVLTRALPSLRQRLPGLSFGVLADICVVGLLALSMWLIVRAGEQPPILHLTFAVVGVRALAIGRAAFRYMERLASHSAALTQLASLRADTFAHLVPRVPGAIEDKRRGDVLAAFVDDVDRLQDHHLRVRQPIVVSLIVVGMTVVVLSLISWIAGLILAAVLVVAGVLAVWLSARIAGRSDRALAQARANLTDRLLERVNSAEVLVAFDALDVQRARIAQAERQLDSVQRARARAAGVTSGILSLASGVAAVLIFLAVLPAVGAPLSAPLFAAVVIVPVVAFEVFAQVPQALVARRTVEASANRVAELTETELPPEIPVDPPVLAGKPGVAHDVAPRFDPQAPAIVVTDLEVTHPGARRPAVQGLNFTLHNGETLVITGDSGAGKSSLALALVRLLDYQGSYILRGIEARELSGSAVRATVGLCEQTPHLFDSDIRQNLKFAREHASDEELLDALGRVGLAQWVQERGGLDASVGEHGALVSGGQAQRIALARALLADFPIIVLDEPTAGVDREQADRLLIDLLGAVPADRAVVLITHTDVPEGLGSATLQLRAPEV